MNYLGTDNILPDIPSKITEQVVIIAIYFLLRYLVA